MGEASIHATATVEPGALLGPGVRVGPYAFVGEHVTLEADVTLHAHAVVVGHTRLGAGTAVFSHAALGGAPQHRDYRGEPTRLEVGAGNVIREHVSIHVGTVAGGGVTRIGDHNLIMNACHVGHDSQLGSHIEMASYCGLAGHVTVEDFAVLGAYAGVHQFARVGESAMAAGSSKVSLDAPPFMLVAGDRARLVGLNSVGLGRRGFPPATISALKRAHRIVFGSQLRLAEALARVQEELGGVPEVQRLAHFLESSERGFCR